MAKWLKFYAIHKFSTSPDSYHHTTYWPSGDKDRWPSAQGQSYLRHCTFVHCTSVLCASLSASPKPGRRRRATLMVFVIIQLVVKKSITTTLSVISLV